MGKIVEGIKIAAYVAEVVVAGSVVIELVSKWNERRKLKSAVRVKAAAGNGLNVMGYEKNQDVVITLLEVAVSVLKGIKKLRSLFVKSKK